MSKQNSFLTCRYVVLFFYPLDFTFVCPTEIIAFSDRIQVLELSNFVFSMFLDTRTASRRARSCSWCWGVWAEQEFKDINVEVIGVSVDSAFSHLAWVNQPRKQGGLGGLSYPLVSDITKSISKDYGVLIEEGELSGAMRNQPLCTTLLAVPSWVLWLHACYLSGCIASVWYLFL